MSTSARPTVFLSYSHQDEDWKDRVVGHLNVLEADLDVWDDRRIAKGDAWFPEIQGAMDRAAVAVLLISKDFLNSKFIKGTEVPHLLKRRRDGGLRVIPLFVRPCAWQAVEWLAEIQGGPKDAKPLSEHRKSPAEKILADLALEIRSWLREPLTPRPPLPLHTPQPGEGEPGSDELAKPGPHASPLSRGTGGRWERGTGGEGPPLLDLGRLPIAGPLLIGRETELARLDAAWEDAKTHVLTFVAFGGMGKSALVSHWLDRMAADDWRGARRILDWSFYSQGTEERVTSADRFLDHALAWFGDPDPKAGAARDRGLRLAELVRQEKTLLVLDGVEPLQHPSSSPLAGRFKDPGLAALLKGLAAGNTGLCVVTTRERIKDLDSSAKTAPQINLEALAPEAGAGLLREIGVEGRESELRAASVEFGSHALTLTLLGTYLKDLCDGDVRRRREVPILEEDADETGHARRVIASYAKSLETPEVEVLRLLGLFDRPAEPAQVKALRVDPPIPGLTETIGISQETRFRKAVARLRKARLVADGGEDLDAHPLVRVFFQGELEKQRPEAWRAGNLRLYEHLQKEAPDLPDTLEAMEPLFSAVIHGCRAGRQQEALGEVFWRRIRRRNEAYNIRRLGAFGSELLALSGLFDHPWDRPSANLTSADQAFLLNAAGFCLRALGRLPEAVQPMEASLEQYRTAEDLEAAAITASNLSELTLILGEVERAVAFGKQSVDLADRGGDAFQRISTRTTLADGLHQAGRWEDSAEAFCEAEALQAERLPQYPRLYSLQGYQYCDLLLSHGEPEDGSVPAGLASEPKAARRFREACREVRERAEQLFQWRVPSDSLLDIALDHLSLGRAHLGLALTVPRPAAPGEKAEAEFTKAAEHLNHAVEGLRHSGNEDILPLGLLARAALRQFRGDLEDIPESHGAIPESLGAIPEPLGAIPESLGAIPESLGCIPESLGYIPETPSYIPESLGYIPETLNYMSEPLGRALQRLDHSHNPGADEGYGNRGEEEARHLAYRPAHGVPHDPSQPGAEREHQEDEDHVEHQGEVSVGR